MLIRTVHGEDLDSVPRSLYYEPWETLKDLFPGRTVMVHFHKISLMTGPVELPWSEEATAKVKPHVRVAAWVEGDKVTLDFRFNARLDYGDAPPGCECGSLTVADCTWCGMSLEPKLYALAVDAVKCYLDQTHYHEQSIEGLLSVEGANFYVWKLDGFDDWKEIEAAIKLAWTTLLKRGR